VRNVCDFCEWQRNRKVDSWFCSKYGIPMHVERIYCVSNDPDKKKVKYTGIVKAEQIQTGDDTK